MTVEQTAGERTAGASPVPTPMSPAIRGAIERGGRIGRYLVLRVQGAGAMGLVYVAYDPELDRKLAVKVLQAEAAHDLGLQKETLIREARALARVSHPNVITVHDVGVHEGQVFIAMELVPGVELGQWLAARAQADSRAPWRRWAELREPLLAAGRGLAAAHAAGLVHRDFKPANVIVGPAGVRVLDFGLARAYLESELRPREADANAQGPGLTATVAVVGTPAYMAPEVHDAAPIDVRADQYAFCITLYEALLGRRPFMGRTGAALVLAKHEPGPWLAEARVLPAFLRQVLTRGLDPDPARRFADMDTLLAALAYDPSARRWWIAGATLALAAAVLWTVAGPREAPRCSGGERRVAAVWNPARADGLRAALRSSGQAPRVVASIDQHVAAWRESYAAACTATFVEREQSQELFDRRQTCLNDRLGELDALVRVLERGDAATGENAVAAVGQLTPLTRCRDEALLAAVEPPPPDLAAEALRVREQLRTAEALERAGQYAQGLPLAEFAASEAQRLAYAPARAEALLRLGMLRQWSGDYAGAEVALSDAAVLATARKYEDIAARAALELVFLVGYQLSRYGEAKVWWRVASAAAERTGHAEEYLPQLWNHWGAAQEVHGAYAAAREAYSEALAGWEARLGPDHPEAAPTLNNLAIIELRLGRSEDALAHHQRALAIREQAYGPTHPEVANSLNSLGTALLTIGRPAEARGYLERALAIYAGMARPEYARAAAVLGNLASVLLAEADLPGAVRAQSRAVTMLVAVRGPDDPGVARARHNLGVALQRLGELGPAERQFARALAIRSERLGGEHPDVALTLAALADLERERGACSHAREMLTRALAIHARADPPAHANHAAAQVLLGDAWRCEGDAVRAREAYARGLALLDAGGLLRHPQRTFAHAGLGHAALLAGDVEVGVAELEEALRLAAEAPIDPGSLGAARMALARALWPGHPERARELAAAAGEAFAAAGPRRAAARASAADWWVEHRAP